MTDSVPRSAMPLRIAVFVVLGAGALGCAPAHVTLASPDPHDVATGCRRGNSRPVVVVSPFDDRRPERIRCGMRKNSFNADVASIRCAAAPELLLPYLLAMDLRASGFQLVGDSTRAPPETVFVRGALDQYFIEPKSNFFSAAIEVDIGISLAVEFPNGQIMQRRLFVKGDEASTYGTPEDIQVAHKSAVRELLLDSVGALANLLDETAPDLRGTGTTPAAATPR